MIENATLVQRRTWQGKTNRDKQKKEGQSVGFGDNTCDGEYDKNKKIGSIRGWERLLTNQMIGSDGLPAM